MNEWIPIPGTAKARLVEVALVAFGQHGYADVAVGDLAEQAQVTVGALYHHFGSKGGLYALVRTEVERRIRDRMEGAEAVPSATLGIVLGVGLDAARRQQVVRLLSEPSPISREDVLAQWIGVRANRRQPALGPLVVGAWQAALAELARDADLAAVRSALARLVGGIDVGPPEHS
ncbi:MAG: helix-turn-helix domain containing protein [Thermaerobacter sp.]|nr:helix-turn-helix domain containing protein [Thermaerobacter sp.]